MSAMSADDISTKLKDARQKAGLTQEQLAGKIMVSRVTVSHWENGKSLPDIASLITLSDLYPISLDEPKMRKKVVQDAKNQKALNRTVKCMLGFTLLIAGIYIVSLIVGGTFQSFWQAAMPYLLIAIYLAAFLAYEGQKTEDKDTEDKNDLHPEQ